MNNNTSIIVFTNKRAFQLDAFINSAIIFFPYLKLPINIIYHYDSKHHRSYKKLFSKWKDYISVYQRNGKHNQINYFELMRPLNLLWYLKFKWIRQFYDNFKELLQEILLKLDTQFVLLSTDDQVFYKQTHINTHIFDVITNFPKKYSYRLTSNHNFNDENRFHRLSVKSIGDFNYLYWKANSQPPNTYWKYRFNVDGTIYDKNLLLKLISKFIFNMPTTLEGIGLWESRFRGYFNNCMGTYNRTYIGIQLSNIQQTTETPAAKFDLNALMELYLKDYTLDFKSLDINENIYIYVPKNIKILKNNKQFLLLENSQIVE